MDQKSTDFADTLRGISVQKCLPSFLASSKMTAAPQCNLECHAVIKPCV